jgi:hypothetical protein
MANSTFATARNLGFLERGGVKNLQGQDSLGGSNRSDVFGFSIQPGLGFKVRSSFQAQGGKMGFSFFVQDPMSGQITKLAGSKKVSGRGTSDVVIRDTPQGAPALNCYIKFDKPTENIKYKFKLASL